MSHQPSLFALLFLLALLSPSVHAFGIACKPAVGDKYLLPRAAPYDLTHLESYLASVPDHEHPTLTARAAATAAADKPPKGLYLAFTGDTILGDETKGVYELVKNEQADAMVISGDFDYVDSPSRFVKQLDAYLPNLPVFMSIGNHDLKKWASSNGYSKVLTDRYKRLGMDKYCTGEVGIKSTCNFKGVTIITSGIGTRGSGHEAYLESALSSASQGAWKFCSWHKNQAKMQTGDKNDEVGWDAYEICRKYGAIVLTGHNHGYSRSHLMSSFTSQKVVSTSSNLAVTPGKSWATVTGTGGRFFYGEGPYADAKWWGATATDKDDPAFGALFCRFNEDGNSPYKASCQFKRYDGKVLDSFTTTFTPGAPAAVAKYENAASKCTPIHVEAAAHTAPTTQRADGMLDLQVSAKGSPGHALAFDVPVPAAVAQAKGKVTIEHAYLQVYGASNVQLGAHPVDMAVDGGKVQRWTISDEAEANEVWNSPDLASALPAGMWSRPTNATAVPVRMTLTPVVDAKIKPVGDVLVHGVAADGCLSPSLVVVGKVCDA
ncbi:hypothetical protein GGF32_006148 [Allomyces javanicus]|nr:hypothetical protein GGF32_006148 [Allomyces javanicus]